MHVSHSDIRIVAACGREMWRWRPLAITLCNTWSVICPSYLPPLVTKKKICGAEQIAGTITYLMVQTPCLAMGEKVYILFIKWEVKMAPTAKMLGRQTLISRISRSVTWPRETPLQWTLSKESWMQEARTDRNLKIYVYISNAAWGPAVFCGLRPHYKFYICVSGDLAKIDI